MCPNCAPWDSLRARRAPKLQNGEDRSWTSHSPKSSRPIRAAIEQICTDFGDEYWLKKDREGGFPHDFHAALAGAGWLGIAMPAESGGAGLGITEAAIMMQTVSESGGGIAAASTVHMNIFGLHPVVVFGTKEQQQRWLPPLISGKHKACFGVTEPNTGPQYAQAQDQGRARRRPLRSERPENLDLDGTGRRTRSCCSPGRRRSKMSLSPRGGLSLFYTDLDRGRIEVREIEKLGRKAVDSNQLFIDELRVPVADRIGEEGKGFDYILHGLNPERILIAAEAIGLGRVALKRAANYANERIVFDRPIGMNQGIQHPLAERWMELEAANLMMLRAAWLYDKGLPCGAEANAAKYLGAEAGFRACETAVLDPRWNGLREGVSRRALFSRIDAAAHRAGQLPAHLLLHRGEGAGSAQVVLNRAHDTLRRRPTSCSVGFRADLMVRQKFQRTHQGRMIPALAAVRRAGVEQLLRRGGVGKRHAHLARRAERQVQILLMELDPKSGIERALDHPLAVHFQNARRGETAHQRLAHLAPGRPPSWRRTAAPRRRPRC